MEERFKDLINPVILILLDTGELHLVRKKIITATELNTSFSAGNSER